MKPEPITVTIEFATRGPPRRVSDESAGFSYNKKVLPCFELVKSWPLIASSTFRMPAASAGAGHVFRAGARLQCHHRVVGFTVVWTLASAAAVDASGRPEPMRAAAAAATLGRVPRALCELPPQQQPATAVGATASVDADAVGRVSDVSATRCTRESLSVRLQIV